MRYAAYGSNLHPLRLRERTPSAVLQGTAALAGFDLEFAKRGRDGSGKCTIREAAGSRVLVAVYELDEADRPALDRAEGRGAGYTLERVEVEQFGACLTYVAQESHRDVALRPYGWYRELVLVGAEALAFPADYLARIRAVEVLRDPDAERHARHMALVDRARRAGLV